MKYLYYMSLVVCGAILALYMFGPYGGPIGIWNAIKHGFYDSNYIKSSFNDTAASNIIYLNQLIAVVFFGIITLCLSLPLFRNMRASLKHKLGVGCLLIICLIIFIPKIASQV